MSCCMHRGRRQIFTSEARTRRRFSDGSSLLTRSLTMLVIKVVAPKLAPVLSIGRMSESSQSLPKTWDACSEIR
eukprot:6181437-Pleurochrysis_carterae.AAC.3